MKRREQRRLIFTFLAPPLAVYFIVVILPALSAFRYSLWQWDGLSEPVSVGLANFKRLLQPGSDLWPALQHNAILMFAPGLFILILALFFAYSIHQRVMGARLFRIAFFFPNIISAVAIAVLWTLIYSTSGFGLLNNLLRLDPPVPFAGSDTLIMAIVPMIVWTATGFYMVLFLASMESIPESFYEAARLDGAGQFALFRKITLPLMWDVLTTGIVFLIIGGLKVFDVVWVMDNGRPTAKTHTMATLMYSRVFEQYNIGQGAAVAVTLFLLVLAATLISLRLMRRERLEY
ncbi:MAG: sugar ABC transporter permease [Armatimonadetes bacterium]|nr:sugar ABC transporter permease [Armatimonadota bacterium]